jgi:branched-chain amino acid transport system substrate-binding protein
MRAVWVFGIAATLTGLLATAASAQIKIGAIISITGPTAALGVGYKNAFAVFPPEIDGKSVTYIIRDDAADASQSVTIAQRMIEEDHADAIIGPSLTACANAV